MTSQRDIFRQREADEWLERNRAALASYSPDRDPLVRVIRPHLRTGSIVAEVGCTLAGRTAAVVQLTGGTGRGIDPSSRAIEEARRLHPQLDLAVATADALPWTDQSVDVLLYGFCLYLCDREDLFRIAAEGDRVLRGEGLLAIIDFHPPFPYRNAYSHRPGVFSYKMDYSRLWAWNPAYVQVSQDLFDHQAVAGQGMSTFEPDERIAVTVLRKLPAYAYTERPAYPGD